MYSRRSFLAGAAAGLAAGAVHAAGLRPEQGTAVPARALLQRALNALELHAERIAQRDFIGIADFALPSRAARFFIVSLADGRTQSHLVAHGRGSDPAHTGWLERFSNEPRSQATSAGAYLTADTYVGAHGHSLRLQGLDDSNSNAAGRAIVVHGAWYVSAAIVGRCGMLGRSEGCFALAQSSLAPVLEHLGGGRLIYADKA